MRKTWAAPSRSTSTRSSPRASSGTSTASTSSASSSARSWPRKYSQEDGNGPGNVQLEHPQVPQDGGRQLAARDRAGGAEGDDERQAAGQRKARSEVHAGDPGARREGPLRRGDQTKIGA